MIEDPHDCPDCGERMSEQEVPTVIVSKRILGYEFQLWRYHLEYVCLRCPDERERQRDEELFNAGAQHGYDDALRKQLRAQA